MFDLNEAIAKAEQLSLPWHFPVRIDGSEHVTRPPTLADMAALQSMAAIGEQGMRDLASSLFANPKPNVQGWGLVQLTAMLTAYAAVMGDHIKKKSLSLAAQAQAAMAAGAPASGT